MPVAAVPQGSPPALPLPAEQVRIAADPTPAPRPAPIQDPALAVATLVRQPAAQAFAAAIFAAGERPVPKRGDAAAELAAAFPLAGLSAASASPIAVHAPADARQPAVDMTSDQWMGAMIEKIETLRDSVDSKIAETRIRLVPDALGRIDVSIRNDGDGVKVHIAADTPAARAILTEAAPRLAELAEARGLKLAATSVDGGLSGGTGGNAAFAERQARQPDAPQPVRPASAANDDAADTDITDITDIRIA